MKHPAEKLNIFPSYITRWMQCPTQWRLRESRKQGSCALAEFVNSPAYHAEPRSAAAVCVFSVAQICNLLYRRIAFCSTSASASALELLEPLPITNRRYGGLEICATRRRCALNTSAAVIFFESSSFAGRLVGRCHRLVRRYREWGIQRRPSAVVRSSRHTPVSDIRRKHSPVRIAPSSSL